jgi:hypothetical protein
VDENGDGMAPLPDGNEKRYVSQSAGAVREELPADDVANCGVEVDGKPIRMGRSRRRTPPSVSTPRN